MERKEPWREYIVNYDLIDSCRIYGLYVRLAGITINSIRKAGKGKTSLPSFDFVYGKVDSTIVPKDYVYVAFPPQSYSKAVSTLDYLKSKDFGIIRVLGKAGNTVLPVSDPSDPDSVNRFRAYLLSEIRNFFSYGGVYYVGGTIYVDVVGRDCSIVKIDSKYIHVEYSEGTRKIRIRLSKTNLSPKRKEDVFDKPSRIVYVPYIMLNDLSYGDGSDETD